MCRVSSIIFDMHRCQVLRFHVRSAMYKPGTCIYVLATSHAFLFMVSDDGHPSTFTCTCSYQLAMQVCTVFAQLTVADKWEGPHVFVVRLRDDAGQLSPGVRIMDNGPKAGLNGVDNGQIWFDHVRVPRDALLNRFADVSAEGVYSSSIPSLTTRFGVVVGGLTVGMPLPGHGCLL